MHRWLIATGALLALVACDSRNVAAPDHPLPSAATVASEAAIYIVNFDETQTTLDAVTNGILNAGAGVVQFDNFSMVAALATPGQLLTIGALPGLEGIYANKQLEYYMLHESVPAIRADAVHVAGITGKGIGVAILDSGIDGAYNADVAYPQYTVQNVKVLYNQNDLFTFGKDAPKPIRKGATLVVENLPNSETSVGHGTHVAGIVGARGTSSNGYYTGVAPGAKLIGIGTGDVLFIFWALAGFDYILDHQQQYNIKVVNNSWGTSGAFDPKDPINEATKKVTSRGITVVFAAGNDGPGQNTLNPYSVAPWVIGVAARSASPIRPIRNRTACWTTARIRSFRRTTSRARTCWATSRRAASRAIRCTIPTLRRPGSTSYRRGRLRGPCSTAMTRIMTFGFARSTRRTCRSTRARRAPRWRRRTSRESWR